MSDLPKASAALLPMRIGSGFDVHAFAAGRRLVIGGVEIPSERGLDGHSDADVLLHAICDALLGAAGLGDIGRHFPDTDPRWKGADSRTLLGRTSQPRATRRPPARRVSVPKARPTASAASSVSSVSCSPRMSYSRKMYAGII